MLAVLKNKKQKERKKKRNKKDLRQSHGDLRWLCLTDIRVFSVSGWRGTFGLSGGINV